MSLPNTLFVGADNADIDRALVERLGTEARASLEKYNAQSELIHESADIRFESPSDPSKNKTIHISTSSLDRSFLLNKTTIMDIDQGKPRVEIKGSNDDYRFTLVRNKEDSPYLLTGYAPAKQSDRHQGSITPAYAYREIDYVLKAIDLKPGFVLKELKWDLPRSFVYAHFEISSSSTPPQMQDWEVWLDPQNQWRVAETSARSPRVIESNKITYGQVLDGLSYPSLIVTSTKQLGAKARPPATISTQLSVDKARKNPGDFRLSAYGLPEPVEFPGAKRGSAIIWFLGVACGSCFALALGFRFLARRKRNSVALIKA
jgi:hypothetical protein